MKFDYDNSRSLRHIVIFKGTISSDQQNMVSISQCMQRLYWLNIIKRPIMYLELLDDGALSLKDFILKLHLHVNHITWLQQLLYCLIFVFTGTLLASVIEYRSVSLFLAIQSSKRVSSSKLRPTPT